MEEPLIPFKSQIAFHLSFTFCGAFLIAVAIFVFMRFPSCSLVVVALGSCVCWLPLNAAAELPAAGPALAFFCLPPPNMLGKAKAVMVTFGSYLI